MAQMPSNIIALPVARDHHRTAFASALHALIVEHAARTGLHPVDLLVETASTGIRRLAELDRAAATELIDTLLCDPAAQAQADKRLAAIADLTRAAGGSL